MCSLGTRRQEVNGRALNLLDSVDNFVPPEGLKVLVAGEKERKREREGERMPFVDVITLETKGLSMSGAM